MYEFNDGLLPAGRRPRLYLAKGGVARKFAGSNIPGFCAIAAQEHEKNGKWSNTTYHLMLAPGVRALHFVSPMHGVWGDNLASWGEVAQKLGLPVEEAQRIVRAEYPRTGERLDKVEAFALEAEAAGGAAEIVVVSFGAPTNKQAAQGYWSEPQTGLTSDGREVILRPDASIQGWSGAGWGKPIVVEPPGAKVVSVQHQPGMHGGYWTINVMVPS